jgi:hypothetical protein
VSTSTFDYALIRLVPYVERGEFINVGVILFCRTQRFLAAKVELDRGRVAVLAPHFDVRCAEKHLELFPRIAAGGEGPIGQLSQAERFHWLTHPRSTSIQVSEIHTGLCQDPASTLEHLMATMVRVDLEV